MLLPLLMQHMKRYLLLLVLLSLTISVYCQQITFQKTFGGTAEDGPNSVIQTNDGGYIITGQTKNFGAGDFAVYLIKTDVNGDSLWTKTFGGTGTDVGFSIKQTTDGGYIIAGSTLSFGSGDFDIYLIKTDSIGSPLWSKTFGGTNDDEGFSVQQTTDGGYIITGSTDSFGSGDYDAYLIKTDANGDTLWTKIFGGIFNDLAYSVQQTTDGGYIVVGYTVSFGAGNADVYLIKTDANGNSLWSKTFGGAIDDQGYLVQQTMDGGYIVAGKATSFGAGNSDVYLIKTDPNGNSLWIKTFGGADYDYGFSVQQTMEGGYIVAGRTVSFGAGGNNVYLIKTDVNGDTLWTKTFGETGYSTGNSVELTNDGGYIIACETTGFGAGNYDIYLIKTDSLGNSGCNQGGTATIVTTPATQVTSPPTIVTSPATIITSPATIVGSGGTVTTLCTTVGIQSAIANPKSKIVVSPNPFTSELAVQSSQEIMQIVVYDLIGTTVYQQELTSNQTSATLNLSFLQQGVYFLNVKANGESRTKKIVKM
jgi:hypothetical protein